MNNKEKYRFSELLIYSVLWAFVFTMPVMMAFNGNGFNQVRVFHELIRLTPFFLLFILHNAVLFRFMQKGKRTIYFGSVALAVLVFSIVAANNNFFFELFNLPQPQRPPGPPEANHIARYFYSLIFALLVVALNVAVKISFRWMESRRNFEQLQKENFKTELALLRHQISPHFFMNTLNNIHALIDFDGEMAKASIVKLSKLMRVLLHDGDKTAFTLSDEIAFLNDYIGLMRIRVTDDVDVRFEFPEQVPPVQVPPLLFISLIENAFKHGIKPSGQSFIHMKMMVSGDELLVTISNSKTGIKPTASGESHIGLSNARKRFELLYGKNHTFEVMETESVFEIKIILPLQ